MRENVEKGAVVAGRSENRLATHGTVDHMEERSGQRSACTTGHRNLQTLWDLARALRKLLAAFVATTSVPLEA
jgi:hypothetical protein